MNFKEIFDTIKGPALAVASAFIPGGPEILAAVNAILPADKKLPESATGQNIVDAVHSLPPDQMASLMEKKLDVQITEINSWEKIQGHLATADAAGSSTRPTIALMMAWTVVGVILVFVTAWAIAMSNSDATVLDAVEKSWPMMLAIIATPTTLLRAYFGLRTKEKQSRYSAASGQDVTTGLTKLIAAFKK